MKNLQKIIIIVHKNGRKMIFLKKIFKKIRILFSKKIMFLFSLKLKDKLKLMDQIRNLDEKQVQSVIRKTFKFLFF